jgi:hypothetical protein
VLGSLEALRERNLLDAVQHCPKVPTSCKTTAAEYYQPALENKIPGERLIIGMHGMVLDSSFFELDINLIPSLTAVHISQS